MSRMKGIRARLRAALRRGAMDARMDEEFRFHLDMEVRRNRELGMSPAEARRQAMLAFGGVEKYRDEMREGRRFGALENLLRDLRYAVRSLLRTPGFTLVAVLTLALGIGANTAVFSAVNGVLLRPLPFAEPDRLVMVWFHNLPQGFERDVTSTLTFLDWKRHGRPFSHMAAFAGSHRNLTGADEPERLRIAWVSDGFFPLLGIEPLLGRGPTAEDHRPGSPLVAVLSHALWARRFAADPAIVGRTVSLNSEPHTVVGVMPPGVRFPEDAELWLPLRFGADETRSGLWLSVLGRLKPGVTLERAQGEMSALGRELAETYPGELRGTGILLEPLHTVIVGEVRPALLVLLGAAGFVLLIACANVANLLLARSATRRREIAIRSALGAGRSRVLQQVLVESLVLGVLGAGAGLLLAVSGVRLLVAGAPSGLPRLENVQIDPAVLLFTLGTALATGLLFGLLPALELARPDLARTLGAITRSTTGGRQGSRLRRWMVATEIALALILLIGAGLMIRSLANLLSVPTGFAVERVLTARLSLPAEEYADDARAVGFFRELLRSVEALPGVRSAGAASTVLLGRLPNSNSIVVEGGSSLPEADRALPVPFDAITPGYLETLGIRLREGRGFAPSDDREAPAVAIVNRALADRFFAGRSPLGRRIAFGEARSERDWMTIVGVVENSRRSGLDAEPRPEVYMPYPQAPFRSMTLVVRTERDPMALAGPLRRAVRALDPDQPVSELSTLEQLLAESIATRRFSMQLLMAFSAIAALLAAVGIYGLIAYGVRQRTRELGVRIALGAGPREVRGLIAREALRYVLPGLAAGLVGALLLTRVLRGLLYGISSTDPLTFGVVGLLLAGVAGVAGYLPARRAARVDPIDALRAE